MADEAPGGLSESIAPPRITHAWRAPAVMFLLGLACFLPWLGSAPLAGTEGHRAITAHQIVGSGEWLLPKLYGRVYLRKPPLHYWTLALLEKATGVANEWVWRLPSALSGAAMAAFIAFMAGRWFGRPADWAAGGACLALVALWSQNRGADIDAMNNLATMVAATCLLDVLWHEGCHRAFVVAGTLAFAALLLLKGPAGLPLIGGVLVSGAVFRGQRHRLARPGVWVILIVGVMIFAAWLVAAYVEAHGRGITADSSGLDEVAKRLGTLDIKQFFKVLILPLIALIYALPVSLGLIFVCVPGGPARVGRCRDLVRALLCALVVAAVINILVRTDNPRYVYVLLPGLALLSGSVAAAWRRGAYDVRTQTALRAALTGIAIAFTGSGLALVAWLWASTGANVRIAIILGMIVTGGFTIVSWMRRRVAQGAIGFLALMVMVSLPSGLLKDEDHRARSAKPASSVLREALPPGVIVHAGAMIQDQPELFYYAGAAAQWHGWGDFSAATIPPGTWVVIHPSEAAGWKAAGAHFDSITPLPTREHGAFLAEYAGVASSPPATRP